MVIKDLVFEKVIASVKPDERKRVVLKKVQIENGISYNIYVNKQGQILLDPQVTIPASELWVFDNKDVLAAVDKGMAESANGQLIKRGSFAEYIDDAS